MRPPLTYSNPNSPNTLLRSLWLALCLPALGASVPPSSGPDPILSLLPPSPAFDEWRQTNSLPDVSTLSAVPFLPDPLRFATGAKVASDEWPQRRQELLGQLQHYLLGRMPPSPKEVRSVDHRPRQQAGALLEEFTLEFGPGFQARLGVELILPKATAPFPVVVVPGDQRFWALVALSRGYAACLYSAHDQKDDSGAWTSLWPRYDWSQLTRRAWAVSRCVDYLQTLPFIDPRRIALSGHGRGGQVALTAAAFDQRVAAVVTSSSGSGGACSFRLFAEPQLGPGLQTLTRLHPGWWHPRLRFFAGREQFLPVDANLLVACIAPRPCLISSAISDPAEDIYAVEQTYYSAARVFDLLGRTHDLNLHYRTGEGELQPEAIETHFDWLDTLLGRNRFLFPDSTLFPTYASWQRISGEEIDPTQFPTNPPTPTLLIDGAGQPIAGPAGWALKRGEIRQRVLWALGQAPPFVESRYHPQTDLPQLERTPEVIPFGNGLRGYLHLPTNAPARPLPVLVWLHPASVSTGHQPPFFNGTSPHLALPQHQIAVFAFDQIGHGTRVNEARNFYPRYPHWSLLGKMVEDTLAAAEALRSHPRIDPYRIFLLGYSQGGWIALHAAALDQRIAGVITVAGLFNTDERYGAEALARWTTWLPMTPRLGAFVGKPNQLPYNSCDLLALIAPRPVSILAPRYDRITPLPAVQQAVDTSAPVYNFLGASSRLQLQILEDYHRLTPQTTQLIADQLPALLQLPAGANGPR